jgi:hypothetical protein
MLLLAATVMARAAAAGPARAADVSLLPAFSATGLGEATTLRATLVFSGTEYHDTVAPLTEVVLHLPAAIGGAATSGFPTCSEAVLEGGGPEACPLGSFAGPAGSIAAAVQIGGEMIDENGSLQAVLAPGGGLLFYMTFVSPISVQLAFRASEAEDAYPYGNKLTLEFPLIGVLPGAPDLSVTELSFELGTSRYEGPVAFNTVTVPAQCPPSGNFSWAADVGFFEQASQHATAEVPCSGVPGTPANGGAGGAGSTSDSGSAGGVQITLPPTGPPAGHPSPPKMPTMAQRLHKALKTCRKLKSKSGRHKCERVARKRYRPTAQRTGARKR